MMKEIVKIYKIDDKKSKKKDEFDSEESLDE